MLCSMNGTTSAEGSRAPLDARNELRGRVHFDVTSEQLKGERALVVRHVRPLRLRVPQQDELPACVFRPHDPTVARRKTTTS